MLIRLSGRHGGSLPGDRPKAQTEPVPAVREGRRRPVPRGCRRARKGRKMPVGKGRDSWWSAVWRVDPVGRKVREGGEAERRASHRIPPRRRMPERSVRHR
ncbi:hypothetical protein CU044_3588 [Streptomyces sp. L-9-10]|nr:hypothetical protein CU044_3588 [Streptomyces sp. L-9-10]